ncbi:uncharacterized protein AB9X84_006395 [Acanthopagrus schlegelii]
MEQLHINRARTSVCELSLFCVKMRVNIYSCLLVFVLGCNVTAAIKHVTVQEKQSVSLSCPHYVVGEMTWSRETNGHRVDILTADVNWDKKHIPDPDRRYSSLVDKSLYIRSVTVSDSGRYFCDNEAAVQLTVIPPAAPHLWQPVRLVIGGVFLIIMISITVTAWTEARQKQKRRATQRENDV